MALNPWGTMGMPADAAQKAALAQLQQLGYFNRSGEGGNGGWAIKTDEGIRPVSRDEDGNYSDSQFNDLLGQSQVDPRAAKFRGYDVTRVGDENQVAAPGLPIYTDPTGVLGNFYFNQEAAKFSKKDSGMDKRLEGIFSTGPLWLATMGLGAIAAPAIGAAGAGAAGVGEAAAGGSLASALGGAGGSLVGGGLSALGEGAALGAGLGGLSGGVGGAAAGLEGASVAGGALGGGMDLGFFDDILGDWTSGFDLGGGGDLPAGDWTSGFDLPGGGDIPGSTLPSQYMPGNSVWDQITQKLQQKLTDPQNLMRLLTGQSGTSGSGAGGINNLNNNNSGGGLLSLAPSLAAIGYAQNQAPFDLSKLNSAYDSISPNSLALPYDIQTGRGRNDLTSSLTQRGVMGSSFANQDMESYDTLRGLGRQNLLTSGATSQATIANQILNAQIAQQKNKNDLYGRALLALSGGMGGASNSLSGLFGDLFSS